MSMTLKKAITLAMDGKAVLFLGSGFSFGAKNCKIVLLGREKHSLIILRIYVDFRGNRCLLKWQLRSIYVKKAMML